MSEQGGGAGFAPIPPGELILVTGAAGFVGRAVVARLAAAGYRVRAAVRRPVRDLREADIRVVRDIAGPVDWPPHLQRVSAVIHLAARVHVLNESAADPEALYHATNVEATARLARAAAAAGVRRFVLMSSIKVNGEGGAEAYTEADPPRPSDGYARSKLAAEAAVAEICAAPGISYTILRPPLVYGPGVGGNFRRLLRLAQVSAGLPLPLGGITNRRSLVYVENLADLVCHSLQSPAAQNQVFLAADDTISTTELIMRLARAMGRRARLFRVPPSLLRTGARLLGRSGEAARLLDSLVVDASRARAALGWTPPITMDQGLNATAAWWLGRRSP